MTWIPRTSRKTSWAVAIAAALGACGRGDGAKGSASSPSPAGTVASPIRFEDVTAAAGIRFSHVFGGAAFDNIVKSVGGGVAVLDYDGDGWMDLYFVNGGADPEITGDWKPAQTPHAALYRNRHDGTFEDVTTKAGVGNEGSYGFGATAADFDGDGRTDLYVCNYRANRLYHNRGDGTFEDVTAAAGVAGSAWSVHAVALDYDRDGALDLYVVDYLKFDPAYRVFYAPEGFPGPLAYAGAADVLYRNRGDGTFEDVTERAGLLAPGNRGMSAVAADFDADGWVDLFVANDAMENAFWRNQGDGTFKNVGVQNGTAYGLNGESTSAMGPAVADYDRNGWLDLFVPDTAFSCLYTNLGPGPSSGSASAISFRDRSAEAKVAQAGGQNVGWGGVFLDADDDGWVDLFRANGSDHHLFGEQSLVLRNRGDGTFEDVSRAAGDAFLRKVVGRSAAVADLWNDGRLSVVMQTVDGGPILLRGRGAEPGHWLGLDLHGTAASPSGPRTLRPSVGTRVKVVAASGAQVDEVRAGSGYLSCSDPRLHFGLGKDASAVRLEIRWPSGDVQTIENVAVDQMLRVDEPQRADGQAR